MAFGVVFLLIFSAIFEKPGSQYQKLRLENARRIPSKTKNVWEEEGIFWKIDAKRKFSGFWFVLMQRDRMEV